MVNLDLGINSEEALAIVKDFSWPYDPYWRISGIS